ncbi:hypothetical protein JI750_18315 [Flavobacterium sp. GN10]|uniref:Capsule polysaccharide biosynthesis protein n=1 Tax=Flavobacterium tagetis TaxID=2801336 RepID=A0ABS1KH91_9FLAO|nr:hypothetical protein [Flavobacterium tagetis]MBL0738856.1 hypothetical protein [Flavobacterium tagetis]
MIPTVLFFARDYQSKLFPLLSSNLYHSVFAVISKKEKQIVIDNGGIEVICFEEEFDNLEYEGTLNSYLQYSYGCDRNYIGLSLFEREKILQKTIIFWKNILERYSPKLIINETVAIEFAEVLAIEAEKKGIKYLSWMSFPKNNTFYWQTSPFHNSLNGVINDVIPCQSNIDEAKEFINGVKQGAERPFYVRNTTSRYSLKKFIGYFKLILLELRMYFIMNKIKRRIIYGTSLKQNLCHIKRYFLSFFYSKSYSRIEDFTDSDLVFYPLHYEPEAVLFYMAYFFDNQIYVIENLLKCLNQNQILVVKEHPQQLGVLLEKRFRDIKKRYPNLIFIKGEEPTVKILNKCDIIITLGSTAGFEALALNKKVVVLGRVFYDSFEGVNVCKSFSELYDLLRGRAKFQISSNFDLFVAKMLKYVKDGNPFPHNELYKTSNINSIISAIEYEIANENK